jgi:crossover junction endodeoxyribonuclease RuvC
MSEVVMGIDPGIASCGYGVIVDEKGDLFYERHGVISTPALLILPERIQLIHEELKGLFLQYRPKIIGVEELFFCKNVKTALVVGQVKGVILLTAIQAQIPVKLFTPLQVKQAVTSYGKAEKRQVQEMVKILLRLKEIPKPDDAADALAVAICCANTL